MICWLLWMSSENSFGSCSYTLKIIQQTPWNKKLFIESSGDTFGNVRCCAKCQPWHHMAALNSSELDNTDTVNYLKCCKCCKWKVSSILWSNHQHQQRPSEKWGCTRNKGMQIMFSSTPNSAQEEPNSIQMFCFSIIQITKKYHTSLRYHDSHGSAVLMNDGPL